MYEEYDSVRFTLFFPPVLAFLGALADCLLGVLAILDDDYDIDRIVSFTAADDSSLV